MPRKFFRKFLPSHESVRSNRHIARLGPWLQHHNLWHLRRRSVAGGIAVGLFAGLIPGSFMTGDRTWFVIGLVVAFVGIVLIVIARRKR